MGIDARVYEDEEPTPPIDSRSRKSINLGGARLHFDTDGAFLGMFSDDTGDWHPRIR